ncbi:hypothetical protein [Methanococcus voltae]|uniref:Uncharacterized protein n=1 Tax=Methanococcus voltae (strain ATCC BAA-1334 / A3) TaxID=456320 RepID=D7DSJ0_METV3|nr:hypothetical protein [Methanococcus voltae]MCS3902001.1 F0F1-type ATP synthase assembly protein I [Methanococcus voltae]
MNKIDKSHYARVVGLLSVLLIAWLVAKYLETEISALLFAILLLIIFTVDIIFRLACCVKHTKNESNH